MSMFASAAAPQPGSSRVRKIMVWTLWALLSAALAGSAASKLLGGPESEAAQAFARYQLGPYRELLGVGELLFVLLFAWPRTLPLGTLLLTAYFGGAVCLQLTHGESVLPPGIFLGLIWLVGYLRYPPLLWRHPVSADSHHQSPA